MQMFYWVFFCEESDLHPAWGLHATTQTDLPTLAVEIATLTREDGKTTIKVLKQKEVEELIKRHEAEEAKAEKDKKEKEQKEKDK